MKRINSLKDTISQDLAGRNRKYEQTSFKYFQYFNWICGFTTPNKSSRADDFTGKLYQTFRLQLTAILLKLFQKIAKEETHPNSFCETTTITLIPKPDKDTTKEKIIGQHHWWT